MPELPEIEAVRRRLGPRLEGRQVTQVSVNPRKGYMLRYPADGLKSELPQRRIERVWRRGKHLVLDLLDAAGDRRHLVVNPMLGGRFHIGSSAAKPPGNWVFGLAVDGGDAMRYSDTRDMGRVYWAGDLERDVPGWTELGPEADSLADVGLDAFRRRLRRYRDAMKEVLRNQAFLAGLGNAYSDEILFEAGILPLRRRASLTQDDEEAL
ncbi:MAG: hypothetical protein KGJ86_16890, partial [Chloroflexota bacterium]|nr:hypothetical protein [Chloroflexota bacterium]